MVIEPCGTKMSPSELGWRRFTILEVKRWLKATSVPRSGVIGTWRPARAATSPAQEPEAFMMCEQRISTVSPVIKLMALAPVILPLFEWMAVTLW